MHFRSMPEGNPVFWLDSANGIADQIEKMLTQNDSVIANAHQWFETINKHPANEASLRILSCDRKRSLQN